jgi:uncharacterized protein
MTTLLDRLESPLPKRILTLDGGGVRGLVSLEFLKPIESILRSRYNKPDFRLCDYFDLISGTSTGAIIAACLAIGMSIDEIKQCYCQLAGRVFGKRRWKQWMARYDERPLMEELEKVFGERTLGDSWLRTGLCMILKRADTNSTWPLFNHPHGKYFSQNRDIRLRDAVRASTAAPTLFVPQMLNVGGDEKAAFIDGAVSMANNPAWQTFLVATLQGFPFRWPTGEDRLFITSIGTGRCSWRDQPQRISRYWINDWAQHVPSMLIDEANMQVQMILQSISKSPTAIEIDSEVGDLRDDSLSIEPLLHYVRYDLGLDATSLNDLGINLPLRKISQLHSLARADNIPLLMECGARAAVSRVKSDHFRAAFDLTELS